MSRRALQTYVSTHLPRAKRATPQKTDISEYEDLNEQCADRHVSMIPETALILLRGEVDELPALAQRFEVSRRQCGTSEQTYGNWPLFIDF